jgi:hypothetical protein
MPNELCCGVLADWQDPHACATQFALSSTPKRIKMVTANAEGRFQGLLACRLELSRGQIQNDPWQ